MSEQPAREELRPLLRDEQPPSDTVVVVRGGPSSVDRLRAHARRTHDAYVLDDQPLWGVSVFCALDDVGTASIDTLLRRFASYRVVHLPTVGQLAAAGFELLPSFRRPHFTIRLADGGERSITLLLEALGRPEANPYHGVSGTEGASRGQRRHHLRSHGRGRVRLRLDLLARGA